MDLQKQTGKRRRLIQSVLYEQALEDITKNQMQNNSDAQIQSEYQKKFCDINFTPTLENNDLLPYKEQKYPLNSSLVRTFYSQQVIEGILKSNDPSLNLKEPFRKNNIISDDIKTTLKKMN